MKTLNDFDLSDMSIEDALNNPEILAALDASFDKLEAVSADTDQQLKNTGHIVLAMDKLIASL